MKATTLHATIEIEVGPGESLVLPDEIARQFSEGTWVLSIYSKDERDERLRDHSAFLNGYCDEDEGLYDDAESG
jgi:hypothetical protein